MSTCSNSPVAPLIWRAWESDRDRKGCLISALQWFSVTLAFNLGFRRFAQKGTKSEFVVGRRFSWLSRLFFSRQKGSATSQIGLVEIWVPRAGKSDGKCRTTNHQKIKHVAPWFTNSARWRFHLFCHVLQRVDVEHVRSKLQMELNNILLCCLPLSIAQSLPSESKRCWDTVCLRPWVLESRQEFL